jgi:predicted membrane chloride channel (bestrophin family)
MSSLSHVASQCYRARLTASPLSFRLSLLLLSAAFLALLLDAQLLDSPLLSLYQAFASTDIESLSVVLKNLFGKEDLGHSAQLLCISAQAGFDDKVGDDFIKSCEGCG